MTSRSTVAWELMQPSLRALARLGRSHRQRAVDSGRRVLSKAGLALEPLGRPGARIPHSVALALFDSSVVASQNTAFPLQAGAAVVRGDFDVLGMAVPTAPTLGEGLRLLAHGLPLLHDSARIEVVVRRNVAHCVFELVGDLHATVATNEYVLALLFATMRLALGRPMPLSAVRFTHPRPAHVAAYRALFGAQAAFDCAHNALVFDAATLDAPLPASDPSVHALLQRYTQELLRRHPRPRSLAVRVEQLVRDKLERTLRLPDLADELGMSESTLQRHLQAEGTSHTQILERTRRELSVELLETTDLGISEVAHRLGFSHRPAFNRAFRRWFRMSPTTYRRHLAANAFYGFYSGSA